MELVKKSRNEFLRKCNYVPDEIFEGVRDVFVEVDRVKDDRVTGGIWYFVRVECHCPDFRVKTDCVRCFGDVNEALDLKDQIDAALDSGVKRLEVTV